MFSSAAVKLAEEALRGYDSNTLSAYDAEGLEATAKVFSLQLIAVVVASMTRW